MNSRHDGVAPALYKKRRHSQMTVTLHDELEALWSYIITIRTTLTQCSDYETIQWDEASQSERESTIVASVKLGIQPIQ